MLIFFQKFKVRKKSKYSFEFIELKDPANMEKFKELGMRIHNDLVGVSENLAALLEGSKSRTFQTHKKRYVQSKVNCVRSILQCKQPSKILI